VRALQPTVFSEFSALAARSGAVNLGQGFPDFDGPEMVREAAVAALRRGENQYAPGLGAVALRQAISEHARRFLGLAIDWETQVVVTCGATEAIFDAVQGLVDPGDEVVAFQPMYDSYAASVAMAGGVLRPVTLQPPDAAHPCWWFDPAELEAAFGPRTRWLLNTPHNPTGKVFTLRELEQVAGLAQRWNAVAVVDEVYGHLVYDGAEHRSLAGLPGMAERTLTVSSGAKTFGFTGWKVGWAMGPRALRDAVLQAHQYVTFAVPTPLQHAVAAALRLPDKYFAELQADYARRRLRLLEALSAAAWCPGHPRAPTSPAWTWPGAASRTTTRSAATSPPGWASLRFPCRRSTWAARRRRAWRASPSARQMQRWTRQPDGCGQRTSARALRRRHEGPLIGATRAER
jgi:N-succinyldiaminopimelate aminotransferase